DRRKHLFFPCRNAILKMNAGHSHNQTNFITKALAMGKVRNILESKGNEVFSIHPDHTVYDALEMLVEKNVGALLVIDGERFVGIFSERDYARKVILKGKASRE